MSSFWFRSCCNDILFTLLRWVETVLFSTLICLQREGERLLWCSTCLQPDQTNIHSHYPAFCIYCIRKLSICPNCSFSRSDWAFDMGGFLCAFAARCMPVVCIVVHHQLFDPRTYRRVRLTLSASASKVGGSCWHFTSCDLVLVLVVVTTLIFLTIEWWENNKWWPSLTNLPR